MKLRVKKSTITMNPEQILRRAGYGYLATRGQGEDSFVRHLGSGLYPRFHMYISNDKEYVTFNLHLDQKKASYQGSHAHNAEYDGDLVESEIRRLMGFVA